MQSASQIPLLLCNKTVRCNVQKGPKLVPILGQMNPNHTFQI